MNLIEMIGKTNKEVYKEVLYETVALMEIIDDYENDICDNDEGSLTYAVAVKLIKPNISRFERNIKLLGVLKD